MNTNSHNLAERMVFLLSILVVLAFVVNPVMALRNVNLRQLPASNDEFANAMAVVEPLPFRNTVSPFEATQAPTDTGSTACNLAAGLATVWYKYTPTATVLLHMDSIGSSYDTFMVLYTFDSSTLTEVACNDDANTLEFGSAINITLTAGVVYYIEVAQFNGNLTDVGVDHVKSVPDVGALRTADALHVFRISPLLTKVFYSVGAQDGYVVESNETSGTGLLKDSTLPYVRVGDDEKKRQYRSFLSFNTESLPDNVVVTVATIKVKQYQISSTNVFSKLGNIRVDIRKPYFGTLTNLESADFNATSSKDWVGTFGTTAVSGWYRANLRYTAFPHFNTTGYTQFRLRFSRDDNNDAIAQYIKFYSGDHSARPILIVKYYEP